MPVVEKYLVPGLVITILIEVLLVLTDLLPGDGGERVRHEPGVPLTAAGQVHQGLPGAVPGVGLLAVAVVREEPGQVVAGQRAGHHSV